MKDEIPTKAQAEVLESTGYLGIPSNAEIARRIVRDLPPAWWMTDTDGRIVRISIEGRAALTRYREQQKGGEA